MFNWLRSIMNIRVAIIKRNHLKVEWLKEIIRLLFSCYLTGLISLVVLPANFWLSFFDGIFLGWWDEMLPIFSFGEFNLVPSFIKALIVKYPTPNEVRF